MPTAKMGTLKEAGQREVNRSWCTWWPMGFFSFWPGSTSNTNVLILAV